MLENKLGLTSSAELARMEEQLSKKKAVLLFEKGIQTPSRQVSFLLCRQSTGICLKIFMNLPERFAR